MLIKLDNIHKQIESIKKIHLGPPKGILTEIIIQQDYYLLKGIKKALTDKDAEITYKAQVDKYNQDLESLNRFFSESPEGITSWTIIQFAEIEEAVYDWKGMEASNEWAKIGLTRLAKIGLHKSGIPTTSKPLCVLETADSLFSIPTLLNQSLARFDSGFHPLPIILSSYSEALFLYPRGSFRTLDDLAALQAELGKRLLDIQAQSKSQMYIVPYLDIPIHQSAIFQIGLLITVFLLAIANRYVIQLRALILKSLSIPKSKDLLVDVFTEITYHSHFLPILQHSLLQWDVKAIVSDTKSGVNVTFRESKMGRITTRLSISLMKIKELVLNILFFAIPSLYLLYWIASRRQTGESDEFYYVLILVLLWFVSQVLVVILGVNLYKISKYVKGIIT